MTPGSWASRAGAGHSGQHQHRDRRHRRARRRNLPGLQRFRHTVAAAARHRRAAPLEQIKSAPAFFDADDLDGDTAFRHIGGRHRRSRTSWSDTATPTGPGADAARRLRRVRGVAGHRATTACSAGCGWPAAEPTCWPTSAAAASTGRRWHTQAMREGRHLVAEDFAAVAKDLVRPRHHHRRTARRAGRQQRRPADGHHADPVPGAVRRAGVQRAAARHAALPPAAGRRVVGGRVRRSRRSGRLGVHRRSTRRTRTSRPIAAIRRC